MYFINSRKKISLSFSIFLIVLLSIVSITFGTETLPANSINAALEPSSIFVVNNNGDTFDANTIDNLCLDSQGNCTLRAAIQQSNTMVGNDTITFSLATPATINLTMGELYITSNITINGLGARNLVIDGTGTSRIFSIYGSSGTVANIDGLTVANGNSGSGGGGRYIQFPAKHVEPQ